MQNLDNALRTFIREIHELGLQGFFPMQIFKGKPDGNNPQVFDRLLETMKSAMVNADSPTSYIFMKSFGDYIDNIFYHYVSDKKIPQSKYLYDPNFYNRLSYVIEELNYLGYSDEEVQEVIYVFGELNYMYMIGYIDDKFNKTPLSVNDFSKKTFDEIINYSINHAVEGIIDSNGIFYPVRTTHIDAVPYLIANGVDLKNAIRVTRTYKKNHRCSTAFSSLGYVESVDPYFAGEESVCITQEQSDTMYRLYTAMKGVGMINDDYESILRDSSNLGWIFRDRFAVGATAKHYNDDDATHNIDMIMKSIDKVYPISTTVHKDQSVYLLLDEVLENNRVTRVILGNESSEM